MSRVEVLLNQIEGLLHEKAPSISSALRPPLGSDQIRRLAEHAEYRLTDDVAAFYRWHDGADMVDGENRAELLPGAQMMPLHESIERRNEASDADRLHSPRGWKGGWLPLFVGFERRYWVVDSSVPDSPVTTFDWIDLPETWRAYRSLSLMLEVIVTCWRGGAYREGPGASVEEDSRAVAQVMRQLDDESPDVSDLVARLASNDDHTFSQALAWLRTRLYPEAVPALIRLLDNESRGRIAAVELLGSIGGSEARAKLRDLANSDPDDLVRDFAGRTLDETG